MNHCLSEEWIELIAIDHIKDPSAPVPLHISQCHFCNTAFEQLLGIYQQAAKFFDDPVPESPLALLSQRIANRNPHLHLLQTIPQKITEQPQQKYTSTLAADAETSPSRVSAVKNLGVFASNDGRLMVRILRADDGKVTLFLLSDEEELYANVLVHLLGMDQEYVTDRNGTIHLGEIDLDDIHDLGIEVRTAAHSYDMKTVFPKSESLIGESEILLNRSDDKQIKLEILPIDGKYSLRVTVTEEHTVLGGSRMKVMVVRGERQPLVKSSVKGVALFQELVDPRTIQIKIFE